MRRLASTLREEWTAVIKHRSRQSIHKGARDRRVTRVQSEGTGPCCRRAPRATRDRTVGAQIARAAMQPAAAPSCRSISSSSASGESSPESTSSNSAGGNAWRSHSARSAHTLTERVDVDTSRIARHQPAGDRIAVGDSDFRPRNATAAQPARARAGPCTRCPGPTRRPAPVPARRGDRIAAVSGYATRKSSTSW